jgi:hypothetical protein
VNAPVIHPNAVYWLTSLTEELGLKANTAAREIRLGRLRSAKRAGRVFVLGSWVMEWLKDGEVVRAERVEVSHDA